MDGDALMRRELLAEVNASIRQLAAGSQSAPAEWRFMCECGAPDCRENVSLTLAAYSALHDGGFPVLALGHRMSPRTQAERLRREAQALRAQTEQQLKRARRNLHDD